MQTELGGPHLVERTGKGFKLKILNLFFYVFLVISMLNVAQSCIFGPQVDAFQVAPS